MCPKSEVQTVKIIASLFYTVFSKFTDIVSLVAELYVVFICMQCVQLWFGCLPWLHIGVLFYSETSIHCFLNTGK